MKQIQYLTYDSSSPWEFPKVEDFIVFLCKFPKDLVISKEWTTKGCPIWHFLVYLGWEDPTVYGNGYWHPEHQEGLVEDYRMPPWASEFSWWEDKIGSRSMSVNDCLNLLDNPVFNPSMWENGKSRPTLGRCIGI